MQIVVSDRRALRVRQTGWRAALARLLRRPIPTYESAFRGTAILEVPQANGFYTAELAVSADQLPILLVHRAGHEAIMVNARIEEVSLA